jgi:hypothetical protein
VRAAAEHEKEAVSGMSTQERSKASFLQERYDFAAWRDPGQPSETLFVLNYLIAPSDLAGYRSERIEELAASEGWPRSVRSLWRSKDADDVLIAVEVFEADSRAAARETLVQSLGEFQAVLEPDREMGEVAFATPARGAVVFALANLVGLVRAAGGSHESVAAVAGQLDVHLRTRPDAGGRVVPEIERLAAGPELPSGAVPISVEARDPLDRPLWFKIFSSGGEVLMQDGQLVFRPYGPGHHALTVFAINENGGVAEETISLGG